MKTKILMVEHDPNDIELIQHELSKGDVDYESRIVQTGEAYENALRTFQPDIILSDYTLPTFDGHTAFDIKERMSPHTPFIFVSGTIGEENSIELIKNGVTDYALKDKLFTLNTKINRALKESKAAQEKVIAQIELIKNEKLLTRAQEVAHIGSWQTNLTNFQVIWSEEIFHIFEIDPKTFQPTHTAFLNFVHPEDRAKVDGAFLNSIEKRTGNNSVEHRIISAKGEVKYVEERWEISYDENGNATLAEGTCQDITERIKAEEKIKDSEGNYRFLFNNNPSVIFIWDLETLQIIEVNQAAEVLYGYTHREFLSMTLLDLRLPHGHEKIKTFARQMLHNPPPFVRANWEHVKKDGATMMMDITGHPINYKGRPSMFSLGENITEKLIIEEELKRSYEDIRKLNAHLQTVREEERARISRELHDELGQQLTGIKMDMVWMGNKLISTDASTSTRVRESLQLIDETVNTLRGIIADLRPEILDDLGLYAALDLYCDEFAKRSGIKCMVEEEGAEPEIEVNISINIFRIFQEALNNVAKHAHATEVKSWIKTGNENIEFTITDNGKGFDKPLVKKSKKTYGLLGMKERAASINGALQIVSVIGKGTTVHAIIPLINKPATL